MKNVIIKPGKLSGQITIPPSKSICHRAVICGGLSNGVSQINNVVFSKDIEATVAGMESLGADIVRENSALKIIGHGMPEVKNPVINCSESGSTLRFLIPLAAITGEIVEFTGKGKLLERLLQPYYDLFDEKSIFYKTDKGRLPLAIEGKLVPGEYRLKGNISSQFISGLLFALPLLEGNSKIVLSTPLESKHYVDLTVEMLEKFSVHIENSDNREIHITGNQKFEAANIDIEGDFSQAAFWLTAGALGGNVACRGLNMKSLQGDRLIVDIIQTMGGRPIIEGDRIKVLPSITRGSTIDASQCPDLVPILTVLAALSQGTTEITNAGRNRLKESDRLSAITCELNKIGADIEESPDSLLIRGKESLKGGIVSSWNDHRIAMALAVASSRCREPIIIEDADCVGKSYPDFWEDFRSLGGDINEWNMGE